MDLWSRVAGYGLNILATCVALKVSFQLSQLPAIVNAVELVLHQQRLNPFTAIGDYDFKRRRLSLDCTILRNIQPISIGLQMFLIKYILYFLKASIHNVILNVKVVPNDIFKFGGERVNQISASERLFS